MAQPPRLMVSGSIQRQNYDCPPGGARQQGGRLVCARLSRQGLALTDGNRTLDLSIVNLELPLRVIKPT